LCRAFENRLWKVFSGENRMALAWKHVMHVLFWLTPLANLAGNAGISIEIVETLIFFNFFFKNLMNKFLSLTFCNLEKVSLIYA
jgi:hypothetical protein